MSVECILIPASISNACARTLARMMATFVTMAVEDVIHVRAGAKET